MDTLLATLAFMAMGLLVAGIALKNTFLSIIGGICWILLSVYSYTLSTTPGTGSWDVYYALFFAAMFVGALSFWEGYSVRKKTTTVETPQGTAKVTTTQTVNDDDEIYDSDMEAEDKSYAEGLERHRQIYSSRSHKRKRQSRAWD
jgi:hypothetical protein